MRPYRPPHAPYLPVAYMDEEVVVIDKPSGLLSVPGKTPDLDDCVEARAKRWLPSAHIVHRLDMDTSGLIILARSKRGQANLSGQFERREIDKTYMAVVWGGPEGDEGVIDLPLIADWPRRPLQKVCFERGKRAVTHWRVVRRGARTTLMRLTPETGRSHQLRVHMLNLGCPIIGDPFYAQGEALAASDRLELYATALAWRCPGDGSRRFVKIEGPMTP